MGALFDAGCGIEDFLVIARGAGWDEAAGARSTGGPERRRTRAILRRVARMGVAEIACRSRQEVAKWWDRMGAEGGRRSGLQPLVSADHDRVWFRERDRFFVGASSKLTPMLLAERMPHARVEVIAAAADVCAGRFDLLGYRGLSFGRPIDWHLDPLASRRAPLVHWSRLDRDDPAAGGHPKVIWELNRHQWLVTLGQAYSLTGDERYAQTFARCVGDWIRDNPRGMGINWASSLEVALRLISWCWALFLFEGSAALTPELLAQMLAGIRDHATHVETYLSHYSSPNTHLTGEALGLFYAGVSFPQMKRALRWRAHGTAILLEQSERQVLPDGVYFEQSTCYQRYSVEIGLHLFVLAERNGIAVPPSLAERVQSMLDFLLAVRSPDGGVPQIGDADGGWLLPLARRDPGDLDGVLSTAAALFRRSDYAWAVRGPAPEILWLLGPAGLEAFDALEPAPPAREPSRLFADGGYAVMRDSWSADAHQVVFDVGAPGSPVLSGHVHADLLSIQCSVLGEPFLVDAGTFGYAAGPWRDFFRGTAAHSTVTLDGLDQATPPRTFNWPTVPRAHLRRWESNDRFDFAVADHEGYQSLTDPVLHRRGILFVKPRCWIVLDEIEGRAEHEIQLQFQFGLVDVTLEPAPWARARGAGGRGLFIQAFSRVPLHAEVVAGELSPIRGWISTHYGQRQPAPLLVYSARTPLPLRILTLLFPTSDASAAAPAVSPLFDAGGRMVGLAFLERNEGIVFGPEGVALDRLHL